MDSKRPYTGTIERLRGVGLRPTRQRLALARLLYDGAGRHVTAEMLHSEAVAANIKVSLATIYNTLHQFTRAGILREVVVDPGRSYFDTNTGDHHHFYNEASGRLEDIPGEKVSIADIPEPPDDTEIARIDVIVRLKPRD